MPLYAHPQASAAAPDTDQAEGPSLDDVAELCEEFGFVPGNNGALLTADVFRAPPLSPLPMLRDMITAAITRWPLATQPAAQPVNLADLRAGADPRVAATAAQAQGVLEDRYEFSVVDSDDCEVAGGSAPTLDDAIREGRNYLRQYNQDGPHKLELRRVLVLDHSEATHD
jgi:hypothetical protein